jgi:hypothetical protein
MPLPPPRRRPEPPDNDPPAALLGAELNPRRPAPPPPERITGKMILQLIGMILLLAIGAFYMLTDSSTDSSKAAEVPRICGFARMNPLPKSATDVLVIQPDESPDHKLNLTFSARDADIREWIKISPGTQKITPTTEPGSISVYDIPPSPLDPQARATKVLWKANAGKVVISVSPPREALQRSR